MGEGLMMNNTHLLEKHTLGFPPKYRAVFDTRLEEKIFIVQAEKVINELGWIILTLQGNRFEIVQEEEVLGMEATLAKIFVSYSSKKIYVESKSFDPYAMRDDGNNCTNVELFIDAFKKVEGQLDSEAILALEAEYERKINWEEYVIPETLPLPYTFRKPMSRVFAGGCIVSSVLLGYLLSQIPLVGTSIIVLITFMFGIAVGFSLYGLMKLCNYTDSKIQLRIMIGTVVLMYIMSLYFQYNSLVSLSGIKIGFDDFISVKLAIGLEIWGRNLTGMGLVIACMFQLAAIYWVAYFVIVFSRDLFIVKRVPAEVIDFGTYHFVKKKTELQIRNELAVKGWDKPQSQNEVFEAMEVVYGIKMPEKVSVPKYVQMWK